MTLTTSMSAAASDLMPDGVAQLQAFSSASAKPQTTSMTVNDVMPDGVAQLQTFSSGISPGQMDAIILRLH